MIRSFVAIEIASATIEKITAAIDQLDPRISGLRWVAPNNFHLTLKFLGDIDESQVDALGNALQRELHPFPRLTISAKGLRVFPATGRAKILWVGLAGNRLAPLAARVEAALLPFGFKPQQTSFTPHLTIGRWRRFDRAPRNLRLELETWKNYEFGESTIDKVILFQSVLNPEGAIYSRLKEVALNTE